MRIWQSSALLLSAALAVPVVALTAAPASAASACPAGPNNVCFYAELNLKSLMQTTSALPNNCLNIAAGTARSAWNRSKYKLTVYEHADCNGHYQSIGAGGQINRPTWRAAAYKLS